MLDEVDDDMAKLRHVSKHIKLGCEGDGLPHDPKKILTIGRQDMRYLSGRARKNGALRRKKCKTIEDKRDFITFALQSVKHSIVHRTRIGDKKRNLELNLKSQAWCPSPPPH